MSIMWPTTMQLVLCQTPPSHEVKGLVTVEWFLGCAESTVMILDKPIKIVSV